MSAKNESKSINLPLTKSGNKVQIGLPSLCAYDDDEDEDEEEIINVNPKIKAAVSQAASSVKASEPPKKPASGLLSLLPPPKSAAFMKAEQKAPVASLLPRSLKTTIQPMDEEFQAKNAKRPKKEEVKPEVRLARPPPPQPPVEAKSSFASSYANEEYDELDDPEPVRFDEESSTSSNASQQAAAAAAQQQPLDAEAWSKLCGGGKRKKGAEPIEITDVRANDILGDTQANLMKQITCEYKPTGNRDYFAGSSRKKHQITYLAYVAKERDQELKNQWAQSKFNKQQSRMKYGF